MTVRFYLKQITAKESKEEKQPEKTVQVYARICYKEVKPFKYYPELQKIKPSDWNSKAQKARKSLKSAPEFNARLDDIKARMNKVFQRFINENDKAPATAIFKNILDKEFKKTKASTQSERVLKTFWGYFDDLLERCNAGTRTNLRTGKPLAVGTIESLGILKLHLKRFEQLKRIRIDFETIDLRFHKMLVEYSTKEGVIQRRRKNGKLTKGGGHSSSTTSKLITNLKVVLKEAFDDGVSSNTIFNHRKFSFIQTKPDTIYLDENEIEALRKVDFTQNRRIERVRDLFILQCNTGVRFVDLPQVKADNIKNGYFEIIQLKTGRPAFIPVKSVVSNLLKQYDGVAPAFISNVKFNGYIKEACKMLPSLQKEVVIEIVRGGKRVKTTFKKYELVTSHTARRSFATNEYNRGELSVREIMLATGHETEKAFFTYIRTTPREFADSAVKKIKEREAKEVKALNHLIAV